MRKLMIATIALVSLLATKVELTAQEPVKPSDTKRAKVLVAVALFRLHAFRDTAKLDYCTAVRVAGDSIALREALESLTAEGAALIEATGAGCEADERLNRQRRQVWVDSVNISGQSARAFGAVIDPGGPTYRETYDLRYHEINGAWTVIRAVVATGIILRPRM